MINISNKPFKLPIPGSPELNVKQILEDIQNPEKHQKLGQLVINTARSVGEFLSGKAELGNVFPPDTCFDGFKREGEEEYEHNSEDGAEKGQWTLAKHQSDESPQQIHNTPIFHMLEGPSGQRVSTFEKKGFEHGDSGLRIIQNGNGVDITEKDGNLFKAWEIKQGSRQEIMFKKAAVKA